MKLFRGITAVIAASLAIHNSASATNTVPSDHRSPFWWLPEHDRGRDVPRPYPRYSKVRGIKIKANRAHRARLAEAFAFMR